MRVVLSTRLVFAALFLVPIPVYGAFSSAMGTEVPEGDAGVFLAGVAV